MINKLKILLSNEINPLSIDGEVLEEKTAYHGSPYEFDSFKLDYLGTGEGNQSYGWGLYFAGNIKVAKEYQKKLGQTIYIIDDIQYCYVRRDGFYNQNTNEKVNMETPEGLLLYSIFREGKNKRYLSKFIKEVDIIDFDDQETTVNSKMRKEALDLLKKLSFKRIGFLYDVDIPNEDELFDWDKKLSMQNKEIQNRIQKILEDLDKNIILIMTINDRTYIKNEYMWLSISSKKHDHDPKLTKYFDRIDNDYVFTAIANTKNKQDALKYVENMMNSNGNTMEEKYWKHFKDTTPIIKNATNYDYALGNIDYFLRYSTIQFEYPNMNMNGEDFYNYLQGYTQDGTGKKASMLLLNYNIKGHQYWDGESRNRKNGTHNYVIYDDTIVKTLKKQKSDYPK
jgi:hypothetical protein